MNSKDFATEWGVAWSFPEANGTSPAANLQSARDMVRNMTSAGHEARVVWRSISRWMEVDPS